MQDTLNKMLRIARTGVGSSELYADMLLSLMPGREHKVDIAYWCYKADRDDFNAILEFMKQYNYNDSSFAYEEAMLPFVDELLTSI